MNSFDHSLRLALIWNGTIYKERVFTQTSEPLITLGDDDENVFSIPAPGLPASLEVFERREKGYRLRFTDRVDVELTLNDEAYDLERLVEENRAIKIGVVSTEEGQASVFELDLHFGDWGILGLGRINIFFQIMGGTEVVAGRSAGEMVDRHLVSAMLVGLALHMAFMLAAFLATPQPELEEIIPLNRFARMTIDDYVDADDEVEPDVVDDGAVDEAQAEVASDEPAEIIDEPVVDDSALAEADEVNVNEIGINLVLDTAGFDSLLADSDGLEAMAAMDMSDDGDRQGGRAGGGDLRGTSTGGQGEGIDGLGQAPTGGSGDGAELIRSGERPLDTGIIIDEPELGGFCDPANIRQVVQARSNRIRNCFERELQINPALAGNISVTWRVQADGSVSDAAIGNSTMNNRSVENCILQTVDRMRFESPDGGVCIINFPFVFTGIQ